MRVKLFLAVPADRAREARSRWGELGGSDSVILPGDDRVQLAFSCSDRDSPDGRRLVELARELGATATGPVLLGQTAAYDQADLDRAELLLVDPGELRRVLEPESFVPMELCPECGLDRIAYTVPEGAVLEKNKAGRYDIFRAELLWFAGANLVAALADCRGLDVKRCRGAAGDEAVYELSARASLGLPNDGTVWSEPCPNCGRRKGTPPEWPVFDVHAYPRSAWDGSDFLVSDLYGYGLFVSRRVFEELSSDRWRRPSGELIAEPVLLLEEGETFA